MTILSIRNLRKSFGGIAALNNVNLEFERGELSSIIGPNGAGKTTLFNVITGQFRCDSGRVEFNGEEITNRPNYTIYRKGLSRSFQVAKIFPLLTTFENVHLAVLAHEGKTREFFSAAKGILSERAYEVLEESGIAEKAKFTAGTLPHGDQKRLDIAIALVSRPKLLLLDEPTSGLSPHESTDMMRFVENIARSRGMTTIFIEHDMKAVFSISEKVRVMHFGEIVAEGKPEDIKRNEKVKSIYLGKS